MTTDDIHSARTTGAGFRKQTGHKPEPAPKPNGQATIGTTEDDLALEFARRHHNALRYVAAWGGWTSWTGEVWERETTLMAFDLARLVCRDAAALVSPRSSRIRARLLSASSRAAVENMARSDRSLARTCDDWDRNDEDFNHPSEGGQ